MPEKLPYELFLDAVKDGEVLDGETGRRVSLAEIAAPGGTELALRLFWEMLVETGQAEVQ